MGRAFLWVAAGGFILASLPMLVVIGYAMVHQIQLNTSPVTPAMKIHPPTLTVLMNTMWWLQGGVLATLIVFGIVSFKHVRYLMAKRRQIVDAIDTSPHEGV
jgi:hypothetical protein